MTFLIFQRKMGICKSVEQIQVRTEVCASTSGRRLTFKGRSRHCLFVVLSRQDQKTCCNQTQGNAFNAGVVARSDL